MSAESDRLQLRIFFTASRALAEREPIFPSLPSLQYVLPQLVELQTT